MHKVNLGRFQTQSSIDNNPLSIEVWQYPEYCQPNKLTELQCPEGRQGTRCLTLYNQLIESLLTWLNLRLFFPSPKDQADITIPKSFIHRTGLSSMASLILRHLININHQIWSKGPHHEYQTRVWRLSPRSQDKGQTSFCFGYP